VEPRRRTWFDDRGLVVGERRLPFYAATVAYWRHAQTQWPALLRALHAQGFTVVDCYVPWRVHEPDPGATLWTGERDLARFVEAALAAGLEVALRVGPRSSAELASFGIPDWVLADRTCQAVTARGTPAWLPTPPRAFPIPSYASRAFHDRVRAWYATVAERIADVDVAALGVDSQAGLFFRQGAFDLDYHPDALAWWRDASGVDEPPREWRTDDAARCALWLKFKDEYIALALETFTRLLTEVGLGDLARFHDLPPGHYGYVDRPRLAHAIGGPLAVTAYSMRRDFPELRRRAIALSGNATLPLAAVPAVLPWLPPLDEGDDATRERDQLLSLLASGARGFAVATPESWLAPLISALNEVDWPSLRRTPEIALVDTRADARLGIATNLLDPIPPLLAEALDIGPAGAAELGTDAAAIAARRWQTAIARALELAQVPYAIVDEATSEDELARYRAVIAPTLERIDRGLWQRLRSLAEHKRAVVVIGPGMPIRDELDQPLDEPAPKRIGKLKAGSLEDLAGLADDLAALAGETSDDWHVERPDEVRTMGFGNKVLCIVSDADRATTAVVLAGAAESLRDPFTNEQFAVEHGRITIALPPRGVRMLVIG
jgi:beta-galactosidase